MENPPPYGSWEEKRAFLRRLLAQRSPAEIGDPNTLALGPAEARTPRARRERDAWLQREFRVLASELVPEFLADLAGPPLDEYAAFLAEYGLPADADLVDAPEFEQFAELEHRVPLAEEFLRWAVAKPDSAVMRWVSYWGLPAWVDEDSLAAAFAPRPDRRLRPSADWGIVAAVCTLGRWRCRRIDSEQDFRLRHPDECEDFPTPRGKPELRRLRRAAVKEVPVPRVFWDTLTESKIDARDRIMGMLRTAIEEELAVIEAADLAGDELEPYPHRLALVHLAWLVRFQLQHQSMPTIADEAGVHRQAVEKAVRRLAGRVGLSLRPSPRGRLRKRPRTVIK